MTQTASISAVSAAETVSPVSGDIAAVEFTPVTAEGLRFLARRGSLPPKVYEKALRLLGLRPSGQDWVVYWLRILLTAGLLFCVAGVICFFAYNWAAMSHFLKFGIIIALMVVTGGAAVWRGPDSLTGSLGLLACGLLAGPLLAVYGQYYQTGADAWELFRAWTIFLMLLALMGRQNGLWLATWIVGSFWAALGFHEAYYFNLGVFDVFWYWPFLVIQLAVLAVWEGALRLGRRSGGFLRAVWQVRLVGSFVIVLLTIINMVNIVICVTSYQYHYFIPGMPLSGAIFYLALVSVGFWWYRYKRPDTLLLTLILFSPIALLYAYMLADWNIWNAGGMLLMAVLLSGLVFVVTRLALHWHRQALRRNFTATEKPPEIRPWQRLLFLHSVTLSQLQTRLDLNDSAAVTALSDNLQHLEPWYIRLILSFSGWVAAFFLIGFMFFVIDQFFNYRSTDTAITIFAVIFIACGAFLVRSSLTFARHFGMAAALAGALALPIGLVILFDMESFWQIPILFTAIICLLFVKHPTMRALAFLALFLCLTDLWLVLWDAVNQQVSGGRLLYYLTKLLSVAAMSVIICCGLKLWHRESLWVQKPVQDDFIRPVILTGLVLVFGFFGLYDAFFQNYQWHRNLWVWELYYRAGYLKAFAHWSGLAAGVGLIFMARLWFKERTGPRRQRYLVYGGAILTVFVAWWLPWLSIGLLFLALGRYLSSLALGGLSMLYLVVCLLWYYFTLQISLLHKSYTLLAVGLLMFLAGLAIYHFFYAQKQEAAHA